MDRQTPQKEVFTPEEVVAISEAFELARKTFLRRLTKQESLALAEVIISVAKQGPMDVQKLATRAIARVL